MMILLLNTITVFLVIQIIPCLLALRLYSSTTSSTKGKVFTYTEDFSTNLFEQHKRRHTSNQSRTRLLASKDGKSRKPPKASKPTTNTAPSSSSSATPSSSLMPRVTNRINIPVRQQIAWAKAYKQISTSSSSSSSQPVKFRKAKGEKVVAEEGPNFDHVDFNKIKPPAVFVDGYNIIGQMDIQNGYDDDDDNSFREKMTFEDRREQLISDLAVLHGATGWWIEVVFDAYKMKQLQNDIGIDGIRVVYTSGGETADGYIERRFYELKGEGYTNMVVATDDLLLRNVAGLNGLGFLSASMLLEDIRYAYRSWDMMQQELEQESAASYPSTLGENLPPEILAAFQSYKDDYYGVNTASKDTEADATKSAASTTGTAPKVKPSKKAQPRKSKSGNQSKKINKDLDFDIGGLKDLDFLGDDNLSFSDDF